MGQPNILLQQSGTAHDKCSSVADADCVCVVLLPLGSFVSMQLAVRCKVEALSFSAHADYDQTSGFLDTLQPPHVVLVHGERGEMMKLRSVSELAARVCRARGVRLMH